MKISSIKTETSYLHRKQSNNTAEMKREKSAFNPKNLKQDNYEQINTTIEKNSDGRVSFKGINPITAFHSVATYAKDNPLVAEALFAIVITCGLRPLAIFATANSEEEKSKCAYQAAKSVSTGVVGLGMTALVTPPFKNAAKNIANKFKNEELKIPPQVLEKNKKIVENAINALTKRANDIKTDVNIQELIKGGKINTETFKEKGTESLKAFTKAIKEQVPDVADDILNGIKAQNSTNNYASAAKNVFDKFFQPAFLPIRAAITIALVPIILKTMGISKGGSKPKEPVQEQNIYNSLNFGFKSQKEKDLFQSFAGVANYENK